MDSPVRLQLKRNDYLRHKLFRKINRRRRAKRQLEIEAPVKELKKRLRLKRTFEDGKDGDISDQQYYSIMERVAKENNPIWNEDRKRNGQQLLSVDEDLLRILNDNSYDYRGYYNKYPNSRANADTHWTDEFKTIYHPTFSIYSRYSGKKSLYNPEGVLGGQWNDDQYIPAWGLRLSTYAGGKDGDIITNTRGESYRIDPDLPMYNDDGTLNAVIDNVNIYSPRGYREAYERRVNNMLLHTENPLTGYAPGLKLTFPEFDLLTMSDLAKPIVNTGLRSAGRMVSKAVKNHRYPLGRPQVPKGYITISPKTRTKIGDVEIDNPELAYRQGGKDMIEDFIDNGIVRGIDSRHIWGETYANNPMFQHGSLFSKELSPGLLVSNGKTKAADVLSRPISEEAALKGGITFRIPDEPFTLANTQAYIFEPNYGYRRVLAEETPSLNWADAIRTPQITAENAASITPEQWTAAQDAAIARRDMAEAQRLRDLHFKVGAPDTKIDVPLWSSSEEAFNSFDLSHFGKTDNGFFGYGHYMTPIEDYAASYHPINRKFYVNMENPYIGNNDQYFNRVQYVKDRLARRKEGVLRNLNEGRVQGIGKRLGITENTSLEDANRILDRYVADETIKWNNKYVKYADEFKGKDGVLSWRDIQGVPNKREGIYKEVVVPRGEQIKLADAVTYGDDGIRIPLGERDNFNLNDIRYGFLPLSIGLTGYSLSNYANGKDSGIHIKPENRGKFTRLKKRTGHSTAWFKAHGTPAQKKMAVFAMNSKRWHH